MSYAPEYYGGSSGGAGLSGNQGAALDRLFAMTTEGNQFTLSALGNVETVDLQPVLDELAAIKSQADKIEQVAANTQPKSKVTIS